MIAYVLYWNEFIGSGVWEKVNTQVSHWRQQGKDVQIHLITRYKGDVPKPEGVETFIYQFSGIKEKSRAWQRLLKNIQGQNPEGVYLRYTLPNLSLLKLASQYPVVIEMNAVDKTEYWQQSKLRGAVNFLLRGILIRKSAGQVLISSEFKRTAPGNAPKLILANGIDFSRYELLKPTTNTHPSYLFIASESHYWQGFDKLEHLARKCPQSKFHIIGMGQQEGSPKNITFHGRVTHDGIPAIAQLCDIGVSSLAMHRKGANENSTLKSREYLAFGLPVIGAYRDTDFPDGEDFYLRLPNTETGVSESIQEISDFAQKWMGSRVSREDCKVIDARYKEEKRIAFMNQIFSK